MPLTKQEALDLFSAICDIHLADEASDALIHNHCEQLKYRIECSYDHSVAFTDDSRPYSPLIVSTPEVIEPAPVPATEVTTPHVPRTRRRATTQDRPTEVQTFFSSPDF